MMTINPEKFGQICDEVWRDRAGILLRRGSLSGEAALERAVYWRFCKAGGEPGRSSAGCAPLLKKLIRQYRDEAEPSR
ncbi:MAG TPA: hypothetical protein VGB17_12950 [Pyrinomonadaceae bacterium]